MHVFYTPDFVSDQGFFTYSTFFFTLNRVVLYGILVLIIRHFSIMLRIWLVVYKFADKKVMVIENVITRISIYWNDFILEPSFD